MPSAARDVLRPLRLALRGGRRTSLNALRALALPVLLLGTAFSYTLTVANKGPDQAGGVNAALSLSSGLSPTSASTTQGNYTVSTGVVTCAMGTLAPGAIATITVTAKSTAAGAQYANAAVSGAGSDTNLASATTTIN